MGGEVRADLHVMRLQWRSVRPALGLAGVGFLIWIAFVRGSLIPLLSNADLGFHELGHLLFGPFGPTLGVLMGSGLQVMVPLGLGVYFLRRGDPVAAGLMAGWMATSLQSVSVYIADAPYQRLPLIGGEHDWAFLLGPRHWDILGSASGIADAVWALGLLVGLGGLALCATPPVADLLARRRAVDRAHWVKTLPVREARPPVEPDGS